MHKQRFKMGLQSQVEKQGSVFLMILTRDGQVRKLVRKSAIAN